MTFETYRDMRFPRHFGDRYINRVLRGKSIRVHDTKYSQFFTLPVFGGVSGDLRDMVVEYNERYEKYKRMYPERNFTAPCHSPYSVRVLHFPDVQKYIKRLNLWE
jgi:hypothetical protein